MTVREQIEKFLTADQLSEATGIPVFKIRRAGKAGTIPSYFFYNGRRLFLLSEVLAAISASKAGGK